MKTRIVEIWINGVKSQTFERSKGNEITEIKVKTHDRTVTIKD